MEGQKQYKVTGRLRGLYLSLCVTASTPEKALELANQSLAFSSDAFKEVKELTEKEEATGTE